MPYAEVPQSRRAGRLFRVQTRVDKRRSARRSGGSIKVSFRGLLDAHRGADARGCRSRTASVPEVAAP
jgi:hypothetical protein